MNEVDRARLHLRETQASLSWVRAAKGGVDPALYRSIPMVVALVREQESRVLAALSWVWDAQQRQIMREGEEALAEIVRLRRAGHDFLIPKEVREFIFSPFKFTDARPPYTAYVAG